jgi:hypothetical protein
MFCISTIILQESRERVTREAYVLPRHHELVSRTPSDVFISYSTDARPWAEKLSNSLKSKGVSTWTDFKSIKPGQRWLHEIQRALDEAKYFLIVVGPKNQIGEWQDLEWQGALQRT